jgi:membrane-associated PAP2 superfamily phosphatase
LFFIVALLSQFTDFDLAISNLFLLDSGRFWLQEYKDLGIQLHDYPKYFSMLVGIFFWLNTITLIACNKFFFKRFLAPKDVIYIATAAIIIPVVIWNIREISAMHCPRELIEYGGDFTYLRIFDAIPFYWESGQCSPSAHASSFLWLGSFLFIKNASIKKWILFYLMIFLICSVQILRGAHFVSHIFYSFACAHLILSFLYFKCFKKRTV